jgi:hypothetical protein
MLEGLFVVATRVSFTKGAGAAEESEPLYSFNFDFN